MLPGRSTSLVPGQPTSQVPSLEEERSSQQKPKLRKSINHGYNLGYFTLWWSRMAREGMKEHDAKGNKEEDDLSSLRRKRMITSDIRVLEPRVYTEEYVPTSRSRITNEVICERPTTTKPVLSQPILSDNFFDENDGGRDMIISDGGILRNNKKLKVSHGGGRVDEVNVVSYLCERTQDSESKSTTSNNTSSGISNILATADLAPGLTAVDSLVSFLRNIKLAP